MEFFNQMFSWTFLSTMFADPIFWSALGTIILVDIALGADNAIAIGLACQKVDPAQRNKAMIIGTGAAIAARIILLLCAGLLMSITGVKAVAGIALVYIAYQMVFGDDDDGNHSQASGMLEAIKLIVVADVLMSMENVVAVAGASQHGGVYSNFLMIFGVLLSIPIILGASSIILKMIDKFPIITLFGGILLVHIGVDLFATEELVAAYVKPYSYVIQTVIACMFAFLYFRKKD